MFFSHSIQQTEDIPCTTGGYNQYKYEFVWVNCEMSSIITLSMTITSLLLIFFHSQLEYHSILAKDHTRGSSYKLYLQMAEILQSASLGLVNTLQNSRKTENTEANYGWLWVAPRNVFDFFPEIFPISIHSIAPRSLCRKSHGGATRAHQRVGVWGGERQVGWCVKTTPMSLWFMILTYTYNIL